MAIFETAAAGLLNPAQRRALALMEVDVYQRRSLPRAPAGAAGGSLPGWSDAECAEPLAQAVARAAGAVDARSFSAQWTAAGLALPDLLTLRASAAAKRALWRQLRTWR